MYKSLQTCRALAALVVLLFHLGGVAALAKYSGQKIFGLPFYFGHAGVYFFFVLSGFIILFVHRRDIGHPARLKNYLWKRATRIYPIYWLVFLGVYLPALAFSETRDSVPHDFGTVIRSLLLVPLDAAKVGGTGAPVLIVAWSLQYEVVFYACFAAAILHRWIGLVVALAVLGIYFFPFRPEVFPFSFLRADWMILFALGMLTAFLVPLRRPGIPAAAAIALGGFAGFLALGLCETLRLPQFSGQDFGYGGCSAMIIYGLVKLEERGWIFGAASFFQILGAASYVLYLIHFPLISVLFKIGQRWSIHGFGGTLVLSIISFFICVSAAILVHKMIERPVLRFCGRRASISSEKSLKSLPIL